jgi:signal peptidase I
MNRTEILYGASLVLLSEGKSIRVKANGYSMFPAITPGSTILIEPLNKKGAPVIGEIVAIKRDKGLIVHRLVRIVEKDGITSYIARGDSNPRADDPVNADLVVGRISVPGNPGENSGEANIKIYTRPNYFYNRLRLLSLLVRLKFMKNSVSPP